MMCSINGCIIFEKERSEEEILSIEEKLRELIVAGEDRGRDSYGIVSISKDGSVIEIKEVGKPSNSIYKKPRFITRNTTIVLSNDRAEPTTEYIPKKTINDIQPFGNKIVVAHNGIIANDKELEAKYNLSRKTRIDSAILPPLLEKIWDYSLESLKRILVNEVLGSYALAIASRDKPDTLYLACNYKPIFLDYNPKLDVLFFSSLESYLKIHEKPLWLDNPRRQLEPYSAIKITTNKKEERISLWAKDKRRRALIVCSAGLDSTVAARLMQIKGYEITLLHFKYRHRAEKREEEQVKRIAKYLGCDLILVDTALFKDVIKHSRLTDTYEEIVKERDGEVGAELAYEWVPARNLIFLSIATGIAEAYGYETIAIGVNLEEGGAYPDNEMIFIEKLNEVLPYATNLQKRVRILMPVGNLMKHEIVKLGIEINAPLHLTWSCYEGGEKHCGRCGPCYMRKKAFEMNGLKDVVEYEVS
jgi:7-cyano-7-deazaguanine synthase